MIRTNCPIYTTVLVWCPLLAVTHTWKIPVRSVREHATLTLAAVASISSVVLVPLAAVGGASRSVTPPIMMLTTAKVPVGRRGQESGGEAAGASRGRQGADLRLGSALAHPLSCVWRCRTGSRPAPGKGRCTGRTPGAATLAGRRPSLIGQDSHVSMTH